MHRHVEDVTFSHRTIIKCKQLGEDQMPAVTESSEHSLLDGFCHVAVTATCSLQVALDLDIMVLLELEQVDPRTRLRQWIGRST